MDSNVQYPLVDSLETLEAAFARVRRAQAVFALSLIHISEPTRRS